MYANKDVQKFVWHCSDLKEIQKALQFLDILLGKKWIQNDRITISEQELVKYLEQMGWDNNEINDIICFLSSPGIYMVDDGEETDSFILHF